MVQLSCHIYSKDTTECLASVFLSVHELVNQEDVDLRQLNIQELPKLPVTLQWHCIRCKILLEFSFP